jgi:hypothetical protein
MKYSLTSPIKVQIKKDGLNVIEEISELFFEAPKNKDREITIFLKKPSLEAK